MKECTKIVEYLNDFNTLLCQLTSIGVKMDEKDKAVTLLCSLPDSWDYVVTSISFSTTDVLEYDSMVSALLTEEVRRKYSSEISTPEAIVARGRSHERAQSSNGKSRSKSKGGKIKARCWYCNKVGHLKKDC